MITMASTNDGTFRLVHETAALRLLSGPQGSMWLESPRYVLDPVTFEAPCETQTRSD